MVNGNIMHPPHTQAQGVDVQAVQAPQAPEVSQAVTATTVYNIDSEINKVG